MRKYAKTWKTTRYGGKLVRHYLLSVILFILAVILGVAIFVSFTHVPDVSFVQPAIAATKAQDALEEPDLSGIPYITKNDAKPSTKPPVAFGGAYYDTFLSVCAGEVACAKDLLAIAMKETGLNPLAVGDHGNSYGLFQIHRGYHPDITIAQAQDPFWSATWTLNRLRSKGYPLYRSRAIMAHNGTPGTEKTLSYLAGVNAKLATLTF